MATEWTSPASGLGSGRALHHILRPSLNVPPTTLSVKPPQNSGSRYGSPGREPLVLNNRTANKGAHVKWLPDQEVAGPKPASRQRAEAKARLDTVYASPAVLRQLHRLVQKTSQTRSPRTHELLRDTVRELRSVMDSGDAEEGDAEEEEGDAEWEAPAHVAAGPRATAHTTPAQSAAAPRAASPDDSSPEAVRERLSLEQRFARASAETAALRQVRLPGPCGAPRHPATSHRTATSPQTILDVIAHAAPTPPSVALPARADPSPSAAAPPGCPTPVPCAHARCVHAAWWWQDLASYRQGGAGRDSPTSASERRARAKRLEPKEGRRSAKGQEPREGPVAVGDEEVEAGGAPPPPPLTRVTAVTDAGPPPRTAAEAAAAPPPHRGVGKPSPGSTRLQRLSRTGALDGTGWRDEEGAEAVAHEVAVEAVEEEVETIREAASCLVQMVASRSAPDLALAPAPASSSQQGVRGSSSAAELQGLPRPAALLPPPPPLGRAPVAGAPGGAPMATPATATEVRTLRFAEPLEERGEPLHEPPPRRRGDAGEAQQAQQAWRDEEAMLVEMGRPLSWRSTPPHAPAE